MDTLHIVSSRTGVGHKLTLAALGIKRTFGSFCVLGKLSPSIQFPLLVLSPLVQLVDGMLWLPTGCHGI